MKMAKRSSEESYLSPLDSPCIHCFFLNLSDSFSFALLSSDAVSLCFRFYSLARSRLDCFCFISALTRYLFHTLIVFWSEQYHVAGSLWTRSRPQKSRHLIIQDKMLPVQIEFTLCVQLSEMRTPCYSVQRTDFAVPLVP